MNKELEFQIDMLKGNINRLCVTKNKEELDQQVDNIKTKIEKIYNIRKKEMIK